MSKKIDKFYKKYTYVSDSVGIYDTEGEALEQDETWVIVDGKLYSKSWEAYEKTIKEK
jgi:hypothetical protein